MLDGNYEVGQVQSRLLASIDGRAIPSSTYPRQLSELHYGGENFSPYAISLTFDKEKATLTCMLPDTYTNQEYVDAIDPMRHLWGKPLVALTDAGEKFEAQTAYCTSQSFDFASDRGGRRIAITASEWQLTRSAPCLWAGKIVGAFPKGLGNLNLRVETKGGRSSFSRTNFVLKGARWTYYLLKQDDKKKLDNTLVIDTSGDDIDHNLLNNEIQFLSYCLGQPLICSFLVGLDDVGESVAYVGGDYGFTRIKPNHSFSPVPNDPVNPWFTTLFHTIARTAERLEDEQQKRALYEVVNLSVESSAEVNYISREVKAVLACLAAARWFAGSVQSLTTTPAEWKSWVDTNNTFPFSATADHEALLISRVLAANTPGPVELVHLALEKALLPINQELLAAVAESSLFLSGQVLVTTYQESENRCIRLRTLCAGLIATAVGYKGPLAGWESEEPKWYGKGVVTQWLSADPDVKPMFFIAQVDDLVPAVSTSELWPTFERPAIPDGSPVRLIEDFARSLASRTNEQVRARIIPLPTFDLDEPRLYDFILESVRQPQSNTVLFTIKQDGQNDPLHIISWEEEVDAIEDEKALTRFLRKVAFATRTRQAVERLLLVTPYES
jgi:hypothetical protein